MRNIFVGDVTSSLPQALLATEGSLGENLTKRPKYRPNRICFSSNTQPGLAKIKANTYKFKAKQWLEVDVSYRVDAIHHTVQKYSSRIYCFMQI